MEFYCLVKMIFVAVGNVSFSNAEKWSFNAAVNGSFSLSFVLYLIRLLVEQRVYTMLRQPTLLATA